MKKSSLSVTIKFVSLFALLVGCQKDPKVIFKEQVSGFIQKGPYITGTTVYLSQLNAKLGQSGKIFTGQILGNDGSFSIMNIDVVSPFVEIRANGYYFDETQGALSDGPLELSAICDLTDLSSINLNVLTSLETRRIKFLVNSGKTFADAKYRAQQEISAVFGIDNDEMPDFEELDITKTSDSDAALLAVSAILLNSRSTAQLSELIGKIALDIENDGVLDDEKFILTLRQSAIDLNVLGIRTNLEDRYKTEGIDADIPDFEKYVYKYISKTPLKPSALSQEASDITTFTASLNGSACANSLKTIVGFEYGTTPEYGNYIPIQDTLDGYVENIVSSNISGLLPNTLYHFRIKAENSLGASYGEDMTFSTLGKIPSILSVSLTNLQTFSPTLNVSFNPNFLSTGVVFEYGTSSSYGQSISVIANSVAGNQIVSITKIISGLLPNTLYHFRIKAENAVGISYSADNTFKTPGNIPGIISVKVDKLQPNSVDLIATINPNLVATEVFCEYGMTDTYGQLVPALVNPITGNQPVTINIDVAGLLKKTYYHFRIKATNLAGTSFSNDIYLRTGDIMSDVDGNTYKTVLIGQKEWMQENLKTTKYNDGTSIPPIISNVDQPGFCWYQNDQTKYSAVYGALYNYYAVATGKLCPLGWHVSTDDEWSELINLIGGTSSGYKLWEKGAFYYNRTPLNQGTNEYFFTALPGGLLVFGNFVWESERGYWFTSSSTDYMIFNNSIRRDVASNFSAESVRCVKD